MNSEKQNRIERRCGQRFEYQLPVQLRIPGEDRVGAGFTQDLSSRGALLWTNFPMHEGMAVEITLTMPSEITLGENMSVCCRARVLRLDSRRAGDKSAVAVQIERYEYLHHQVPFLQQDTASPIHGLS